MGAVGVGYELLEIIKNGLGSWKEFLSAGDFGCIYSFHGFIIPYLAIYCLLYHDKSESKSASYSWGVGSKNLKQVLDFYSPPTTSEPTVRLLNALLYK